MDRLVNLFILVVLEFRMYFFVVRFQRATLVELADVEIIHTGATHTP